MSEPKLDITCAYCNKPFCVPLREGVSALVLLEGWMSSTGGRCPDCWATHTASIAAKQLKEESPCL